MKAPMFSQLACRCALSWPVLSAGIKEPAVRVQAPGGYAFVVVEEEVPKDTTVMTELCLAVTDLSRSLGRQRHNHLLSILYLLSMPSPAQHSLCLAVTDLSRMDAPH